MTPLGRIQENFTIVGIRNKWKIWGNLKEKEVREVASTLTEVAQAEANEVGARKKVQDRSGFRANLESG